MRREVSPSGDKTIQIPYCEACRGRMASHTATHLGAVLASMLLGVAGCLFMPLLPWVPRTAAVSIAVVLALVPWVLEKIWLIATQIRGGYAQRAAYLCSEGITCLNVDWAGAMGRHLDLPVRFRRGGWVAAVGWSAAGVIIAATATPSLHDAFHCETRIVNLTEDELVIAVDGHLLASLKATSQENPLAGAVVRLASGTRHVVARRHDGSIVHEATIQVRAGQTYFYAPAHPSSTCFWIERAGIGRSKTDKLAQEFLSPINEFWELPVAINVWFTPAIGHRPEPFTGGVVTSLRQGPCRPGTSR